MGLGVFDARTHSGEVMVIVNVKNAFKETEKAFITSRTEQEHRNTPSWLHPVSCSHSLGYFPKCGIKSLGKVSEVGAGGPTSCWWPPSIGNTSEDRYLTLQGRRNPFDPDNVIQNEIQKATGMLLST